MAGRPSTQSPSVRPRWLWTMDWMGSSAARPVTTSVPITPKEYCLPPGETPGLPGKDRASTGSPEVSSGLDRFSSDSSPNPSFSVFSVRSAVNPQADEQEPNHRVLRGLRESLDFNGVFRTAATRQEPRSCGRPIGFAFAESALLGPQRLGGSLALPMLFLFSRLPSNCLVDVKGCYWRAPRSRTAAQIFSRRLAFPERIFRRTSGLGSNRRRVARVCAPWH